MKRTKRPSKYVGKDKLPRKQLLELICRAGNQVARRTGCSYTCLLMDDLGVPASVFNPYWYDLFRTETNDYVDRAPSVHSRLLRLWWHWNPAGPYSDPTYHDERQIRLMMLAWFHEMVRTGEFDRITRIGGES